MKSLTAFRISRASRRRECGPFEQDAIFRLRRCLDRVRCLFGFGGGVGHSGCAHQNTTSSASRKSSAPKSAAMTTPIMPVMTHTTTARAGALVVERLADGDDHRDEHPHGRDHVDGPADDREPCRRCAGSPATRRTRSCAAARRRSSGLRLRHQVHADDVGGDRPEHPQQQREHHAMQDRRVVEARRQADARREARQRRRQSAPGRWPCGRLRFPRRPERQALPRRSLSAERSSMTVNSLRSVA